jgi:hypothetical protein
MPRTQQNKQYLNFVGGLNTESSPLAFPEGAAKSLDNVDLLRDGSIKRRRGIDYESSGRLSTSTFAHGTYDTLAVTTHEWESVDGQDDLNFLVIQVGGTLHFHDLGADSLSTGVVGTLDLTPINTDPLFTKEPIDSASGKGKLFIVGRYISPAYIQYDRDTDTFTGVKITVKIRDIEGIDEEISSPQVFGDDITADEPTTDPVFDVQDVIPTVDFDDFDGSFFEALAPFAEIGGGSPQW